jgi:hypothetical protein
LGRILKEVVAVCTKVLKREVLRELPVVGVDKNEDIQINLLFNSGAKAESLNNS